MNKLTNPISLIVLLFAINLFFIPQINGLETEQLKVNLNIDYTLTDFGIKKSDIISIATMVKGSLENDPAFKNNSSVINVLNGAL